MPKQMPPWATKIIALVLLAAMYVLHHAEVFPPGFKWHGIDVLGVCSDLIGVFAAVGINGPALWPALAAFLGNPSAAKVAAARVDAGLPPAKPDIAPKP